MKKLITVLGISIIALLVFAGCSNKDNMLFTQSGLEKVHIKELIVTNEVTKETKNITDADAISKFGSELDSIDVKDAKDSEEHSGCNVPGQNQYYIEILGENNKVVGDVIISKKGDIQLNNFENKYIKEINNEEASKALGTIITENINP